MILADLADIKFKARNFNQANMRIIERAWGEVSKYLLLATQLLAELGFSEKTITAENVLLPIAYYLKSRQLDDRYLSSSHEAADRAKIRSWVIRSLLRGGIWTGAVDSILLTSRDSINSASETGFPLAELESELQRNRKSLVFSQDEVTELLDTKHCSAKAFFLLSLLYPGTPVNQQFHIDHVFPRAKLRVSNLRNAGLEEDQIAASGHVLTRSRTCSS